MRLSPAPVRSRTRGARTGTGPRPVMIARSGRWPWRTSRWRPSPVCLSAWPLRKAATSASTACANRARAPSRRTSVSGSENSAGWISLTIVSWVTACHSFGGEVEARTPPRYAASTPHAVTNFRAYLVSVQAHLEVRRPPGQVLGAGMAMMVRDVLAQPAPERLDRHQIRAVARQRHQRDIQGRRGLPDGFGPVIRRPIPQHDQWALGHLGAQALQHLDRVFAIGAPVGPQPNLALVVEVQPVERDPRG